MTPPAPVILPEARWAYRVELERDRVSTLMRGGVVDGVQPKQFRDAEMKEIAAAILNLRRKVTPIDLPAVREELAHNGAAASGRPWGAILGDLYDRPAVVQHGEDYQRRLNGYAGCEAIIAGTREVLDHLEAPGGVSDPEFAMRAARDRLLQVCAELPKPEGLRAMTADEIVAAGNAPVEWSVANLYPVRSIRIPSGPSKTSKTTTHLALALLQIYGGRFAGVFDCGGGHTVAWLDAENSPGSWARKFAAVCRGIGIDPRQPIADGQLVYVNAPGLYLDRPAVLENVIRMCAKANATEIVLDSLTRIHRQKENDAVAMSNFFVDSIFRLRDEVGAGITIPHHHRKPMRGFVEDSGEALRGSSDLRAVVDTHITIGRDRRDPSLYALHVTAQRDAAEIAPVAWRTIWSDDPLTVVFEAADVPAAEGRTGNPVGRPPKARDVAMKVLREALDSDPALTWTTAEGLCRDAGVGRTTARLALREIRGE